MEREFTDLVSPRTKTLSNRMATEIERRQLDGQTS